MQEITEPKRTRQNYIKVNPCHLTFMQLLHVSYVRLCTVLMEHLSLFTGHFKLFEDPVLGGTVNLGDSLLLPTAQGQQSEPSAGLFLDEETDTLFRYRSCNPILWLAYTYARFSPGLNRHFGEWALNRMHQNASDQKTEKAGPDHIRRGSGTHYDHIQRQCKCILLPSTRIAFIYIRGKRLMRVWVSNREIICNRVLRKSEVSCHRFKPKI